MERVIYSDFPTFETLTKYTSHPTTTIEGKPRVKIDEETWNVDDEKILLQYYFWALSAATAGDGRHCETNA